MRRFIVGEARGRVRHAGFAAGHPVLPAPQEAPLSDPFLGRRGREARVLLTWARDNTRIALAIGLGLLLLGSVAIALPPHSIVLGVVLALPSVLILSAVVSARGPHRWWIVIAIFAGCWCVSTLGLGFNRLMIQVAGRVESCQYLNQTEGPEGKYGGVTVTYTVGCPDGTYKFSTGSFDIPVSHGRILVRSGGSLFGVQPAGTSNWELVFIALPAPVILGALLVAAVRTPRSGGWLAAYTS